MVCFWIGKRVSKKEYTLYACEILKIMDNPIDDKHICHRKYGGIAPDKFAKVLKWLQQAGLQLT